MAKRLKASAWRRAFLRALARTGNVRASAAAAGVDRETAYNHRSKDGAFAARWAEAVAKSKAHPPSREAVGGKGRELVLRRSKHGDKLVAAAEGRWSQRVEDMFFATLERTACVRAAARAAGISTNALYYRRDKYPEFAEKWRAVEEAALQRLPTLLRAASIASLDPEVEASGLPRVNVDQAIAISRLKGGGGGGDPHARNRQQKKRASPGELAAAIMKNLAILRKRKLAKGWIESEEGHLIPPGWKRTGQ